MEGPTAYYDSPVGWIRISGNAFGLKAITFLDEIPETKADTPECLQPAIDQLDEYFAGNRRVFDLPQAAAGTEFQMKVWEELRRIPFGLTISYTELARKLESEGAVRAVGHANGRNPLNIITPCHRVIGSDGKLTGYGGGLWRKEWLLKFEKSLTLTGLFQQVTE